MAILCLQTKVFFKEAGKTDATCKQFLKLIFHEVGGMEANIKPVV